MARPRRAIAMVEAVRETDAKTSTSRRFCITSAPLAPRQFAAAARAHRGIENRLHWVLDVAFHDDLSRTGTGNAARNMAVVKHFALNLINAAGDKISIRSRRKMAAWSAEYLERIITGKA